MISDQEDLTSSNINGYFVRVGDTQDEIVLYRSNNGSEVAIIDAAEGIVNSSTSNPFRIRVNRDASNLWTLEYDDGDIGSFVTAGAATDATHLSSTHFGIFIQQSSANAAVNSHFFDDFVVTGSVLPDTTPPMIVTVSATSSTTVVVDFSEDVDQATAENLSNYGINNGVTVSNAERDLVDNSIVNLTVSTLQNGGSFQLTVNNVEDENGNVILANSTADFEFIEFSVAGFRDLVINEFIADPDPPIGLPNAEFVEIFNPTNNFYNLENWNIGDNSGLSGEFEAFTLRPNSFVIICPNADTTAFQAFGDVIGVTSFPNFNGSSPDAVILQDENDAIIDQVNYEEAPADGVSFEQINPNLPCTGPFNFQPSTNTSGGTPGSTNSVFDNSPDTRGPSIVSFEVISPTEIFIIFSESLDTANVDNDAFELNGFTIQSTFQEFDDRVLVTLSTPLISEVFYLLEFSGITDCSGNDLENTLFQFFYDISPPSVEEVVVATRNSIFLIFNEPVNESDVEDEDNFNLNQGFGIPDRNTLQDSTLNRVLVSFENEFEEGQVFTLEYLGIRDTLGNEIGATVNIEFLFLDQVDTAQVVAPNILQLTYDEQPTASSATNRNNYLLEDLGRPSTIIPISQDPFTYRLVWDENFDDNEEILLFIEGVQSEDSGNDLITPAPQIEFDTRSPSLDSLAVTSDTTLLLIFDELLVQSLAENVSFFRLGNGENPIRSEASGNQVILTFENSFEIELEQTLTYTEQSDLFGNAFSTNRTVDFTYDPRPPFVQSIFQFDQNSISIIANEQLASASISTTNFQVDNIEPSTIDVFGPDSVEIRLNFAGNIRSAESISYQIFGWQDLRGNDLQTPISGQINTQNPNVVFNQANNGQGLTITFSDAMGSSAFSIENYTTDINQITSVTQISTAQAQLEFQDPFQESELININLSGIADLGGNNLQDTTLAFVFNDFFDELDVIDSLTLMLTFDTEFESLANDNFILNGTENPVLTIIDQERSDVRLLLNNPIIENESQRLSLVNLMDRFGRILPDIDVQFATDAIGPRLQSVTSINQETIEIEFNELLNEETALSPLQYEIIGIGIPLEVLNVEDSTVSLRFQGLVSGVTYDVVTRDIADANNNFTFADTITFIFEPPPVGRSANFNELIITEIMADPDPPVGLPNAEYIEIFNRSNDLITLEDVSISDAGTSSNFLSGNIGPGEYLIVASNSGAAQFSGDLAQGVSNFPSLSNEGERLRINSGDGVVFQIDYQRAWHTDDERSEGGFSLEIRDVNNPCAGQINWGSSDAQTGGTPGVANSIQQEVPDNFGPNLIDAVGISTDSIRLTFDEKISPADNTQITISDGINVEEVLFLDDFPDNLFAKLIPELDVSFPYTVSVADTRDCLNNLIRNNETTLVLPENGLPDEILISEVLFDPRPNGFDFVEIFNTTDKFINLQNWTLANESSADLITDQELVIPPAGYLVFTEDTMDIRFNYPNAINLVQVDDLPTLSNDEGTIIIRNELGQTIDSLFYEEDFHSNLLEDTEGVSIERISFQASANDPNNWISASSTVGFATPGLPNSQQIGERVFSGTISIEPQVFVPGTGRPGMPTFTTINYQFDSPDQFANVSIYDQTGRLVRDLVDGVSLSTIGFLQWDGSDNSGNVVRLGYYVVVFEVFSSNGASNIIRETVVVGRDF